MREYIVNLTNYLIGKHRFDEIKRENVRGGNFIDLVTHTLEAFEVSEMRAQTLGKIMCALELGDLQVSKAEMRNNLYFRGEGEDMLRHLVSFCLALAIQARLAPIPEDDIPAYRRPALV